MAEIMPLPRPSPRTARVLGLWHEVIGRALATLPQDFSSRQMGILLTVYLEDGPHSIKHLSQRLNISKPAICRAIDVLERLKFVKRQRDKEDMRNVLVQRTSKGAAYLSEFAEIIVTVLKTWA